MELLQKAGLSAYVGKVNMDRNSPEFWLRETQQSLIDTKEWVMHPRSLIHWLNPLLHLDLYHLVPSGIQWVD